MQLGVSRFVPHLKFVDFLTNVEKIVDFEIQFVFSYDEK